MRRSGWWVLALGCTSLLAMGQDALTLNEAVARALANHPRLVAETARIDVAEGFTKQAGLRPNPRLYIQSENWNFPGAPPQPIASTFTDQFLYASQLLETGGKRQRRVEVAESGVDLVERDREIVQRQIAARVKLAYWSAVGALGVVDLLRENQQTLQRSVDYHTIQVREGAIPEADLVRVQLEADRGRVTLESAVREATLARVTLFREMGETTFPEVRLTEPLVDAPVPGVADINEVFAVRPDVRRAQQTIEQAQSNVRLQKAGASPDVEVLSGYKRTAGYNTFMWGVQVALPFANRNQGNIAAAMSQVHAAEGDARALEVQVRAEVEAAQRDAESRRERLNNLMRESLSRANEVVEIARAAYLEGGIDLLRLLDAERTHIELEVLNERLLTEYRQSLVVLETAIGGAP